MLSALVSLPVASRRTAGRTTAVPALVLEAPGSLNLTGTIPAAIDLHANAMLC